MRRDRRVTLQTLLAGLLLGLAPGCVAVDSVELGGACKQQEECKDPADTCITLPDRKVCSMACSATDPCPEGYACARMDVRIEGTGGSAPAGGYCLDRTTIASHISTIPPKGGRKAERKARRKARREARREAQKE